VKKIEDTRRQTRQETQEEEWSERGRREEKEN
jgi:hypothetical protein